MNTPDLADLEAFVAVATARSFRGAAKLRNQSPSALSEAIRRLEGRLDIRLLNRTTRSVTPTEAGQRLLERLVPALGEVGEALQAVHGNASTIGGTLRLNVPSAVSDLVLPPIITRFMATHPAVRVEVVADNNFIDVLAAGFDAGIRYGERVERDMIAIPIGPRVQRYVTAASPAYLRLHGRPTHPNDLLDHACLRFRFTSGVLPAWEFSRDGKSLKVSPRGPLITNRVELQLAAAQAGLGLIHGFEGFIAPDVAAGKLEFVLEDWSERFPGPFLYYASRRNMPGPLRAFVDFLKSEQVPLA
jgi:DNA-binding transcriptional LysR family regulator